MGRPRSIIDTKNDEHFRNFAGVLQRAIAKYGIVENPEEHQKQQLTQLLQLERAFRDAVLAHPRGREVYDRFIEYIREDRRQILDARPFFKERKEVFNKQISFALARRDIDELATYAVSFEFIAFVMLEFDWEGTSVFDLYGRISELRQELAVRNMPLAINRARLFFSRTQNANLSLMDLIQVAAKGLLNGIDKYTPEFSGEIVPRKFRSTAMGRMGGDFIERNSETMLHFYPSDKRVLYRANKATRRSVAAANDFEVLAAEVNSKARPDGHQTDATDVADIMAAAAYVSANAQVSPDASSPDRVVELIDTFAASDEWRPDVRAEENDIAERMVRALGQLTIFERKVLRLRGVR